MNGPCVYCSVRSWTTMSCCEPTHLLCDECLERHQRTACIKRMSYYCPKCHELVEKFGDAIFMCIVSNCERIYACRKCGFLGPEQGYACFEHTSSVLCSGCLSLFPLYGHGYVRLLYCIPRFKIRRQYCANCYRSAKVFITAMWRFVRTKQFSVPPQILEQIIAEWMKAKRKIHGGVRP
jgi:hypothetical protein